MDTRMKIGKGNRGSALLIVAYLGIVLFGVVGIYFYRSSESASTDSRVRESVEGTRTAAEYAAELAIANLSDMEYSTDGTGLRQSVVQDWVMAHPYGTTGVAATERRISGRAGQSNEYEYRVLVRSVRAARELDETSDAMPKGWLTQIKPQDYHYGSDPVRKFTNAYEVVASARYAGNDDLSPTMAAESNVRTVVNMSYNSLANDQDDMAVLHVTKPATLNVGKQLAMHDDSDWWAGGNGLVEGAPGTVGAVDRSTGEENEGQGGQAGHLAYGENQIWVSAEDHYAVKATKDVIKEEMIEGLAAIPNIPSQLYSVVNDIWDAGKMTLHFQNGETPNPTIPRTPNFSTNLIDRQMVVLDPTAEKVDEYVFGGKRYSGQYYSKPVESGSNIIYGYGRSVTIQEDGLIKETSGAAATPSLYAESALAVGSVENMLRFYLNFVDANFPANNASEAAVNSWKQNDWRRLPLGYHTKNKTANGRLREYRRPLDNRLSDPRRRWTVLLWIKDRKGRFLVRDHSSWRTSSNYSSGELTPSSDPLRNSYPYPMSKWNGRYRWSMYGGYGSNSNSDGGHYHIGNFSAYDQHAATKQTIHTRILTLEELLGYKFYKDQSGVPAKVKDFDPANPPAQEFLPDNMIVAGVPDYYLVDGKKVPYEPYEAGGTQFNEAFQRQVRSDNYGVTSPSQFNSQYPTDAIYVYDDVTKETKSYKTLRDFAYVLDISDTPGVVDEREVVLLHMVFENTPEVTSTTPNMYFDMGLTVTVVYPKSVSSAGDDDFLEEAFRHWWEGSSAESTTGNDSHYAVSAIPSGLVIGETDDVERIKKYYQEFGFYDPENPDKVIDSLYTMVDTDGKQIGFARAVFDAEGKLNYTRIPEEYHGARTFYYGRDNLYDFFAINPDLYKASLLLTQEEVDSFGNDLVGYNQLLLERRTAIALGQMRSLNSGITFKRLPERFDSSHVEAKISEDSTEALLIPSKSISARYFAAKAFGYRNYRVPAAYARWNTDYSALLRMRYRDLTSGGSNDEIPTTKDTVHFMPGEMVPDTSDGSFEQAKEMGKPLYQPMMAKTGFKQPNTRILRPTFVWKTTDVPGEIDMSKIHNYPDWFLGTDPTESDINTQDLSVPLLKKYPREHRGALGWHREGPNPTVPEDLSEYNVTPEQYRLVYGDNYEFVIMSEKGFNPYYDIKSDNKNYLGLIRPETPEDVALSDCKPVLKQPKDMPDFVLDGEAIDGAGILVVNGNLVVETSFAYHGTLVVLGDLKVKPKEYMLFNENGNPYDIDGNELRMMDGAWYYWDSSGNRFQSKPRTEWRGSVVVQGKVVMGGSISTVAVKDSDERMHYGLVDLRGSTQAIEETTGLWINVAPNEGFEYDRLGWTTGTGYDYDFWNKE